jgi:hypothetical protein
VYGSGAVVFAWSLLIRRQQRARRQAETPPIVLCKFPRPALDIVAKVPERRRESKFVQYSTLDRRFLESKMRVDSQIWNIVSHTDAKNLFTISARFCRSPQRINSTGTGQQADIARTSSICRL